MPPETSQRGDVETSGAVRGLDRFEGFSDAVFAIALTLLIVEIKVRGSPEGPHSYSDLASAMAEQWGEFLTLFLCYVVIGAYLLQHLKQLEIRRSILNSAFCIAWRRPKPVQT